MKIVDDTTLMGAGTAVYTACTYTTADACSDPAPVTITNCSDIPTPTS